jgi:hypothetical protein
MIDAIFMWRARQFPWDKRFGGLGARPSGSVE